MKIVVVGGTGLIGSKVVSILLDGGHEAIAASPDTGVDIITGAGVAAILKDAAVVIDVANSPSFEAQAVMDFFTTAATTIVTSARPANVRHYVALSVVGTERLTESPYLRAKVAQERIIASSGIPYTLVHATQFFEFARAIIDAATVGDEVRLPHALFQPMAAADVAQAVADAAVRTPVNGTVEVAGPEKLYMDDLARSMLAFDANKRTVIADPEATYFGAHIEKTSLLPGPDARLSATRFASWLEQAPPPRRPNPALAQPAAMKA